MIRWLLGLLLLSILTGCGSKKRLYFQDAEGLAEVPGLDTAISPITVDEQDILSITVTGLDPSLDPYLRIGAAQGEGGSGASSPYLSGYRVGDDGNIRLPLIGEVNVLHLTLPELEAKLHSLYSEYVKDPYVRVKFLTFKVYVLGEVTQPGLITLPTENATVLDAIALSGDITEFGNLEEVKLIRRGEELRVYELDLTSLAALSSEGFELKPNDILYIEAQSGKNFARVAQYLSLGFAVGGFLLQILNLALRY